MKKPYRRAMALGSLLLVAGLAAAGAVSAKDDNPLAGYRETGKVVQCLRLFNIDQTRILDSQNILFKLKDGRLYISKLPHRCPGLARDRAISYSLSVTQLCDLDIITVIDTGLRQEVGSCGLGRFHEVERVESGDQGAQRGQGDHGDRPANGEGGH